MKTRDDLIDSIKNNALELMNVDLDCKCINEIIDIGFLLSVILSDWHSMERLLKAGANPDACDTNGKTGLMYAAERGDTKSVKMLINSGCDIFIETKNNDVIGYEMRTIGSCSGTAICYAALNQNFDIQKMIEEAGARE